MYNQKDEYRDQPRNISQHRSGKRILIYLGVALLGCVLLYLVGGT